MTPENIRELIVAACRILFDQGHEHLYLGHVSAREPGHDDRFWVKRSGIGLAEVTEDDLLLLDLEGNVVAGRGPLHLEMPLHAEIYRRRADVRAIVHTHPLHAAALAATASGVRVLSQDGLPFAAGVGWFDSPLLVATADQGRALAEALGDRNLVLLRHHGIVAADATIEAAVYLAVSFERSVRLQHVAATLGEVRDLGADEIDELNRQLGGTHESRARVAFEYLRRQSTR